MKKTILFVGLLLVMFFSFGQAKFELGLKGGANFSNADAGSVNTDGITALHGGAYGLIKVASFGIQPEILWSKQGSELSGGSEINLNYINVPVMVKFYLPLGFNLQAGPQFGILLDAEQDGTSFNDQLKNSDLSAALGAGWDAPFGLQLSARYILGLSDNSDAPDFEYSNRMFQLSVGFRLFKIGN